MARRRQRRVRTPEGAKRYGVPIGSIIPAGGARTARPVLDRLGEQMSLFGKDQATLTTPKPKERPGVKARLDAAQTRLDAVTSPKPAPRKVAANTLVVGDRVQIDDDLYAEITALDYDGDNVRLRYRPDNESKSYSDQLPENEPVVLVGHSDGAATKPSTAPVVQARDVAPPEIGWRPVPGDNTTYTRVTRFKAGDAMHLPTATGSAAYEVMGTKESMGRVSLTLRDVDTDEQIARDFSIGEFLDRFDRPEGVTKFAPPIDLRETDVRGTGIHPGITSFGSEITAPQAINDLPRMKELFAMRHAETVDLLTSSLSGEYGKSGMRVEITGVERTTQESEGFESLYVYGTINAPDGEEIGELARTITYDDDGRLKVHNDLLQINEDWRGKGFASNFYGATESWFRRAGVEYIDIMASLEDGAYTWGKSGFTWDPAHVGPNSWFIGSIRQSMREHAEKLNAHDKARLLALERRMYSDDLDSWPHPRTISMFTDSDGNELGRSIMHYQDWYGIKPL